MMRTACWVLCPMSRWQHRDLAVVVVVVVSRGWGRSYRVAYSGSRTGGNYRYSSSSDCLAHVSPTKKQYFGSTVYSLNLVPSCFLTLIYVAVCIYDTQILNGFFSLNSYVQKYWNNFFYHYKVGTGIVFIHMFLNLWHNYAFIIFKVHF